ncbi:MAG: pyridoxine 5'-phosphate synthase [Pirellulales bacterium]
MQTGVRLGVNIDHVATVREARRTNEPDPVWAAALAELGGADGITIHLREDRRHIQDRDLRILKETVAVPLNLELACDDQIVAIACQVRPGQVTLVPERREEVTTEGGLDVQGQRDRVHTAVARLHEAGLPVSLFLDPDPRQIEAAIDLRAEAVELHTGQYALAEREDAQATQLDVIRQAAAQVVHAGMILHAGHGLTYRNVVPIAGIGAMRDLNIGHSIVARAIMVGMEQAVRQMKQLIVQASGLRTRQP